MADSGSQPPRCPCGFWGSEATAGLCSKCFKERQETSEPAQTPRTCSEDALRPTSSDVGKRHMESPLAGQMNPEKRLKLDCNVSKEEINNTKVEEDDDEEEDEKEETDKRTTQKKDETGENGNNVENKSLDDPKNGASESLSSTTTVSQKESALKKRCNECRIKLNPALREIGRCKCGKVFCQLHRLPEQHICEFDHKEEGRREARQKMVNPEKQMGNNMERLQ